MRNVFNSLLIALAFFDSSFLFLSILETFRNTSLETNLHIHLFPHLLYPSRSIMMTASIFLPVAIAIERYRAVYYHTRLDQNGSCCRVLNYLIPVICLALVINIPKFLEAETYTYDDRVYLKPSDLRLHPDYILYNMWFRIIFSGVIPSTLLMYFNIKIYQGIRVIRLLPLLT